MHDGSSDIDVADKLLIPFIRQAKKPYFLAWQMDGQHPPFSVNTLSRHQLFEHNYLDSVHQTDEVIAKLLATVDDNTWVFFISDHGALHHDLSLDIPLVIQPPRRDLKNILENKQLQFVLQNSKRPVIVYDVIYTMIKIFGYERVTMPDHGVFNLRLDQVNMNRLRYPSIDYSDIRITREMKPAEGNTVTLADLPLN